MQVNNVEVLRPVTVRDSGRLVDLLEQDVCDTLFRVREIKKLADANPSILMHMRGELEEIWLLSIDIVKAMRNGRRR